MAVDEIKIKINVDDSQSNNSLKSVKENLKSINKELEGVAVGSDRYKELTTEANKFNTILKESKVNSKMISAVEGSLQGMKNELKLATQELKNMDQGSEAYDKQIKKIQKLNFEIKEASDELKDFNFMQGVIGDFTEFAGALTKISGGLAQMGLQGNETLEQMMQTMNRVMGTLMMLEGIQKIQVASIKAWGSAVAVLEKGYEKFGNVLKGGFKSMSLFAISVGAIVVAIKLLYDWFSNSQNKVKSYQKSIDGLVIKNDELRKSHNEHVTSMKKLGNEIAVLTGQMTKQQQVLSDLRASYELELKNISDELEKNLEDQTTFWGVLKNLFTDDVKLINKAFDEYRLKRKEADEKNNEEIKKGRLNADAEEIKRILSVQNENLEIQKRTNEQNLIIKKRGYVNVYNLISLEESKLNKMIENSEAAISKFKNRGLEEEVKAQTRQHQRLIQSQKDLNIQKIALEEHARKVLNDLESKYIDSKIALIEDDATKQIEVVKKRIDDTNKQAENEKKTTLLNVKENSKQYNDIIKYYNDIKINNEKAASKEIERIQEAENNRILDLIEDRYNRKKELEIKNQNELFEIYSRELKKVENNNDLEIYLIESQIKTKQISEKEGNEKILNIKKEYFQRVIDENKAANDKVIELNNKINENEKQRIKELAGITDAKEVERINKKYDRIKTGYENEINLNKSFSDAYLKAVDDKNTLEIEKEKKTTDEIVKQYEKRAEAFKAIQQGVFDMASQISSAYFENEKENREAQLEDSLSKIDSKFTEEQTMLENHKKQGAITEEKYQKQLKDIEERKAKEVRSLKEMNWRSEQEQKKQQIMAESALGVIKAVVANVANPVMMAIASGLVISTAAIQLSVINKQKMPKFKTGGDVGGLPHTQGGTIIEAEKGEFIVNKESMKNVEAANIVRSINNNKAVNVNVNKEDLNMIVNTVVSNIVKIPVILTQNDIDINQRKVNLLNNNNKL